MSPNSRLWVPRAVLSVLITVIPVFVPGLWGQTKYKTLYTFTGGSDGTNPWGGLILDSAGNLYGTTLDGGSTMFCFLSQGCGTAFELSRNPDGTWKETLLYSFCSLSNCADGDALVGGLVLDPSGALYGTTEAGGSGAYCPFLFEGGCGVVFKLTPNPDGSWTESVLYNFCSQPLCSDGWGGIRNLIFDQAGNLYGTTSLGGGIRSCTDGCGVVFKLMPNPDGSWTESVLHAFRGGNDGSVPQSGVILDTAGNLYGTTIIGGGATTCPVGCGVVFKLTPSGEEEILHRFRGGLDGVAPFAGLTFDPSGNLYGATERGGNLSQCYGTTSCGVVFKLSPNSNGGWTESVLHRFDLFQNGNEPTGAPILDPRGNLYGTTNVGGDQSPCPNSEGCGVVFKLTPSLSGGWSETVLHYFLGHPGACPVAGMIFDSAGNLYGTSSGSGIDGFGSVFEVTP